MTTLRARQLERLGDMLVDRALAHGSGVTVFDVADPAQRAHLAGLLLDVYGRVVHQLNDAQKAIERVRFAATRPDKTLDDTVPVRVILRALADPRAMTPEPADL